MFAPAFSIISITAGIFLNFGFGLALAWYLSVLVWRLRRGTAGVRPIEDLAEHEQGAGTQRRGKS